MYIKVTFPVKSMHILKGSMKIDCGNRRFCLHADSNGLLNAISFEMKSASSDDYPKVEKISGVLHLDLSSPTTGALLDIARTAEGLLAIYGVHEFDFQNVKIERLAESQTEKELLKVPSFSISSVPPKPEPINETALNLIAQGLIASDSAQDTQIPLNFFKRGNIAGNHGMFINAFYEYYFMIESEYGDGKFKEKEIIKAFGKSDQLRLYTENVKSLSAELLFTAKDAEMIRKKYSPKSFDECWREIVLLRGKLHHHSKNHPTKWNPHIHAPYEVDIVFLRAVCAQVAFQMFNKFGLDPQTINTLRSAKLTQEEIPKAPVQEPRQLPTVGHIEGMVLRPGQTRETSFCLLQYTDQHKQLYELRIPLLDALYLLNMLEAAERQGGYRQRNRPDRNHLTGRVESVGYSNKPNVQPLEQEMAIRLDDGANPEPWEMRFGMADAVVIHDEIRRRAKNLGLKISD